MELKQILLQFKEQKYLKKFGTKIIQSHATL